MLSPGPVDSESSMAPLSVCVPINLVLANESKGYRGVSRPPTKRSQRKEERQILPAEERNKAQQSIML